VGPPRDKPETAAEAVLRRASGRPSVAEAIAWLAEGHPLKEGVEPVEALRALEQLGENGAANLTDARRRLAKDAADSEVDSARELFALDKLSPLSTYRRVLDRLAHACRDGDLANITASAVKLAQQSDPHTVHVLCLIAGITFRELDDRVAVGEFPNDPEGPWTAAAIAAAFKVIDDVVRGREKASIAQASPARPRELIQTPYPGMRGGWELVEAMRRGGVPYEVLLAQREVGSAWNLHRAATTSLVNRGIAKELCVLLEKRGVEALRSSAVGGDVAPAALKTLAGSDVKNVGLIVLDRRGKAGYGVWFATARDGGSARKRIDGLAGTAQVKIPTAVVVTGPGWSDRNVIADLSRTFQGNLYTEKTLAQLGDAIAEHVSRGTS
jgi:hypothetical protein